LIIDQLVDLLFLLFLSFILRFFSLFVVRLVTFKGFIVLQLTNGIVRNEVGVRLTWVDRDRS